MGYSNEILDLARQAIEAQAADTRADEQVAADGADFICDTRLDFEQRRLDHERARAAAERVAANHYRILLGDAFFARLHNTWTVA